MANTTQRVSGLPFPILLVCIGLAACGGDTTRPTGSNPTGDPGGGDGTFGTDAPISPGSGSVIEPLQIDPEPGGHFLDLFPIGSILTTNVGKDGIPALTDPRFVGANSGEASYLRDSDTVIGLVVNGEAKAYPHNILWWHEIVNDTVGGEHVVVTLCPLTGTGMVFDGDGDGDRVELGVSGRLFSNNLIMYDRRDDTSRETNYSQMTAKGITGRRRGAELTLMHRIETTWEYWKLLHPETSVISDRTGFNRSYATYPYGSYRDPDAPPQFSTNPSLTSNDRAQLLDWKELVLGVRFGEIAMAYPFAVMRSQPLINDEVDGTPILVVFSELHGLALPFSRSVNGQVLTFERIASSNPLYSYSIRDAETGSRWNLMGEAISGELEGEQLEPIPAHNAFWFAWATFWQNTGVY